jgi:hypothetical protein
MDRVQRNGGTAGIVGAVILVLAFLAFMSTGLDPEAASDPSKAVAVITQRPSQFAAAGILFAIGTLVTLVFTVGLNSRLREPAPTRAAAFLYLAIVGIAGYVLDSILLWQGMPVIAASAAKDQVAAGQTWLALNAVHLTFDAVGGTSVGAAQVVAGWAILQTRAMGTALGWLSIVTGVVTILALFARASMVLYLASFVLLVVWLAWTGSALRRA